MKSSRSQLNRALSDAVITKDIAAVRNLLKQGAEVNYRDAEHDETLLMLAVKFADNDTVELLLKAGTHAEARDDKGQTPLFFASPLTEKFALLVKAGADVQARDNEGNSILMKSIAACASVTEVRILLQMGIDPDLRNKDRETALTIAESYSLVEIMEQLRSSAG